MKHLMIIGAIAFSISLSAQIQTSYKVETFGSAATGEHTPFWTVNHNWGTVSADANNFYVRGGIFHEQKLNRDWSFDAGIDVLGGNASNYSKAWIQQLYGRLNWKIFRLDVGMREDYLSLLNPNLSSGSMTRSNNARPLPQIQIGMPDYFLIPYTKGCFFFKGEASAGKYLDGKWQAEIARPYQKNYVQNVLSHHKAVYFRFGDIEHRHRQQFIVSMHHEAQWGGDFYLPHIDETTQNRYYEFYAKRHNFLDFIYAALAKGGEGTASSTDQSFISGSQWGSYTFRYDYKLRNNYRISAYLQHFFEDGTGMGFFNYPDNIYGLEFRSNEKSLVSGVVLEYIYTKHQTGPIHFTLGMDKAHYQDLYLYGGGNDNYYNNVEYQQGPSHFGKTTGTPLFLSPEYNTDGSLNFHNNRISACHLGMEGYVHPDWQYRLLLTTGQGWGRFYRPFTSVQNGFASQLEIIYTCPKIDGLSAKLSIGCDTGEFFGGETFGGGITIRKTGDLIAR